MDTSYNAYRLVIHGGAGTLLPDQFTPELEQKYKSALQEALDAGESILKAGGKALDAVCEAVRIMEESPLFNAGKGSVFTHEGHHELDASLMDGKTQKAGAVCAVRKVRNPIKLCRSIMDSEFVMLSGDGAEQFASDNGIELVENSFFSTEFRKEQLEDARKAGRVQLDHSGEDKFGTVGAVALDKEGNLAAGTSTGGMTNKRYGRVGDSPLIGCGTWADQHCAVSSTGWGEFFIRHAVAYRVAARSAFLKESLEDSAQQVIMEEIPALGGDGGLIALDAQGNISMPFNTPGMYRAYVKEGQAPVIGIFNSDDSDASN